MTRHVGLPADLAAPSAASVSAEEVRAGLGRSGQKTLPSKYLYDAVGSALFEAICHLPEYGLTRADERILNRNAPEIVDAMRPPIEVAELGSGNGRKTRHMLEALARSGPVTYYPIDISAIALGECERELSRIPSVRVRPVHAEYLEGLTWVTERRSPGTRLLTLFLGSTIGNFDRTAADGFLCDLRGVLEPGDGLLLSTDLVKPVDRMLRAYDDPAGVTAAFNKNLLARVNRELDADFDLSKFTHVARWNERERSIEMHLRSEARQEARIRGAGLTVSFESGETIWTESSHKYALEEPAELGAHAGFRAAGRWVDEDWPFAQTLLLA